MTAVDEAARPGRRTARRRRPRAQTAVVLLAAAAGVVAGLTGDPRPAAGSGGRPAGTPVTTATAPSPTTADPAPPPAAARARTSLFGHTDPGGALDLLVAFGVDPANGASTAVLVPSATLLEVPSLGAQTLRDVARLADLDLLETTVENALGAAFEARAVVDDAGLIELLAPAARFEIDLAAPVRVDDGSGTFALPAGRQQIDAAQAVRLLVADDPRGELEHLVGVQAVVDGWRRALRDPAVARDTLAAGPAAADLARAAAGTMRFETLPVDGISTGGDERFRLRREEVDALVDRAFPWARLGERPRPRVEILNGTGGVGVTRAVAALVVPAGGEVTLTGNVPGFGVAESRVVYYRAEHARDAERLASALGLDGIAVATRPVDVVDLTVVVGSDFPEPGA